MDKLTSKAGETMATRGHGDWQAVLAHHDSEIKNLGQRMGGVEGGLAKLQTEVHAGFTSVRSDISKDFSSLAGAIASVNSKLDNRPTINVHQTISTVATVAVLFSMIVAGIIWVTQSQFSGVVAEQRAFNQAIGARVERNTTAIEKIGEWMTIAKREARR